MESLRDKVVLVTGASSGIGAATAVEFAKYGARLTLSGRDKITLLQTAQTCQAAGLSSDKVQPVAGDLKDAAYRKTLIDTTIQHYGRLDVLVNAAGISHLVNLSETDPKLYDDTMETNIRAPFFLTQLAIPHLKASKGNVVNVSSQFSTMAVPELYGVYCMSKAAMDMFTKCLALELGPHGIRVNSVNPGSVRTKLELRGPTGLTPERYEMLLENEKKRHPIGRIGTPEDIAWCIVFLACDKSSFISGEFLYSDGASQHVTGTVTC